MAKQTKITNFFSPNKSSEAITNKDLESSQSSNSSVICITSSSDIPNKNIKPKERKESQNPKRFKKGVTVLDSSDDEDDGHAPGDTDNVENRLKLDKKQDIVQIDIDDDDDDDDNNDDGDQIVEDGIIGMKVRSPQNGRKM